MPNRNGTIFIVILALFIFTAQPNAEPVVKKTYSLDELIEIALSKNETIDSQKLIVQSHIFAKKQAGIWQNPSLNLNYGRISSEGTSGNAFRVSLKQPFYFPGKQSLKEEIAEMDQKLAQVDLKSRKLFVRFKVTQLAYRYAATRQLLEHTEKRVKRFKLIKAYMRNRPFVSPQLRAERNVVRSKLRTAEKELTQLQTIIGTAWFKLNLYLNFDKEVEIDLDWIDKLPTINSKNILTKALDQNFSLKKLKLVERRLLKEKQLSGKQVYPDFALSTYFDQESAVNKEQRFGLGVTFNLPLFDRSQNRSKSLELKAKAQKLEIQFAKRKTAQALLVRFADLEKSKKQLKLFPLSVLAKENKELYALDSGFKKNRIQLMTYLEAESESNVSYVSVYDAQIEFIEAYTEILFFIGEENLKTGGKNVK